MGVKEKEDIENDVEKTADRELMFLTDSKGFGNKDSAVDGTIYYSVEDEETVMEMVNSIEFKSKKDFEDVIATVSTTENRGTTTKNTTIEKTTTITKTTTTVTTEKINKYILNTNTMKIHTSSCYTTKDMDPENKQEVQGKLEDFISQGYEVCKKCYPK